MPNVITKRTVIWGGQFKWVPDGTSVTITEVEHIVSAAYAPPVDNAAFISLGNVQKFDVAAGKAKVVIKGPQQFSYKARLKTIITDNDLKIMLDLTDWTEPALQSLFMLAAQPVAAAGAVEPMQQGAPITGWLQMDAGDQGDVKLVTGILRCELDVSKLAGAENSVNYQMELQVLFNSLNTVNLLAL